MQTIVEKIAIQLEVTKKAAKEVFDFVTGEIAAELKATGKLKVPAIGTFEVKTRPARTARNPKTGEPVAVPEKYVVKFKPSKPLTDSVQ